MPARSGVPQLILNFSFILFINQISTFMKKNLFLAGALALFAVVGVSAQNWSRTLATGLPGKEITHDVNGTQVTQYRAETALFEKAGAKGVRYTVVNTNNTNMAYGGGPFFCLGEIVVLGAEGDTIQYTVTSNADHNSGGAGTDGAGLPALNDGNLNNFFHSSWGGTEPGGLHYLELTFAEPVDAFQLVWYTRPNQHVNRPTVVGLTEPGVDFTEDMLFAEYEFEAGAQVTNASEFANGGTFTLFANGPTSYEGTETNNGDTYIALSGYKTGFYTEATVTNLVQFIPATDGKFVLYQPVSETYYGSADKWTDAYNGKNGWQRATDDATRLGEFEITKRADGDFEITTYATRQYVDGAWVDYDEPIKLWVGYDMRGNLKTFPQNVKEGLEQEDYTLGFGLPVDFGFTIYNASVSKEMVPDKTVAEMCDEVLENIIKVAEEKQEEYADVIAEYDWEDAEGNLIEALDAANKALTNGNLAGAFEAKSKLEAALAKLVAQKANYYEELHGELDAEVEDNLATPPYTQDMTGKYTQASVVLLAQVKVLFDNAMKYEEYSYSQIEAMYAQIESLLDRLEGTRLSFSEFPAKIEDAPNVLTNKHRVHESNVVNLVASVKGIRLTFTATNSTHMNDGYPQVVLAEFELFDAEGEQVDLSVSNFATNSIQDGEGALSNICNGIIDAEDGVTEGGYEYWHSIWNGTAHNPSGHVYLDVTFPEPMSSFSFKFTGRNIDGDRDQQFPTAYVLTEVGNAYDPLLFAENPYNVFVGEKVKNVSEITADGLYVIKGLLNTVPVYKEETEGEGEEAVTTIKEVEPEGTAMFYHGTDRFHASDAAVRAAGVYRFVPNGDGTFKALSLGLGKYWPSTTETGFVGDKSTFEADKAAKLNIVASTNVEGAFLMYEKIEGLTTGGDSIDTDEDGVKDAIDEIFQTPYVMFMDWANSLATRPVVDPQPVVTSAELADNWGDAQCFAKENGETEWEIYKVTMDNPDFFYLTNLTGAFDKLGLVVGTDPGCVSDLGALEAVLAEGQRVVADSAYADAPAAAAALAKEIAAVNSLEKNPMAEGVYQVVSANPDFKAKQNVEKALYAHVTEDGTATFGWKTIEQDNIDFYFHFTKSENGEDLEAGETVEEGQGDLVYNIRAIATYEPETPYYIGEVEGQSTPVELFSDAYSDYLVLNATGSAFTFRLAGKGAGMSIHANQHGGGTGQSGNIVYWDGGAGASQWYLRKVDYETSIDDFVAEGTEAVAVSYFTPSGAAVPAPVKGINIVVTVYANGVVETKKVLVK